ncbi:hypothetical protein V6N12_052859 [Hibiscus sabdariffa]|uniref:SAG family member n=1 Tax=Hibiscus sabdariffa TaxID=183260 RepID=A0ABR2C334_9ROSI
MAIIFLPSHGEKGQLGVAFFTVLAECTALRSLDVSTVESVVVENGVANINSVLTMCSLQSAHKVTANPADELVAVLNANRTAHKSSSLADNPGLACIALQYIKAYQGDCKAVGEPKKPSDSEFAETFAPNCDVEVSTLSPITGRFLGCQSKYVEPSEAFSMLMESEKSLEILYSKNHTEVGAAATGTAGGAPYFWCVLFSSGKHNSSFVLEGGVAKISRPGCFSGADDECSSADDLSRPGHMWLYAVTAFIAAGYAFRL